MRVLRAISCAVLILGFGGCGWLFPSEKGSGSGYEPIVVDVVEDVIPIGELWGKCFPNGTCHDGLACSVNNLCIECPTGTNGCQCFGNDTCHEGYNCEEGRCAKPTAGYREGPCYDDGTCDPGLICTTAQLCFECEPGTSGCMCLAGGGCLHGLACLDNTCLDQRPLPGAPLLPGWSDVLDASCPADGDWQDVESATVCGGFAPGFVNSWMTTAGVLHWNDDLVPAPGATPQNFVEAVRWCSGVLVGGNLFLTAAECLDSVVAQDAGWMLPPTVSTPTDFCANMHVDFKYMNKPDTGDPYVYGGHTGVDYKCKHVLEIGFQGLDYALIELEGCPGSIYGSAELASELPETDERLMMFHFPGGKPEKTSCGSAQEVTQELFFYSDLAVYSGSAGAGVFTPDGKLAGLHLKGGCEAGGAAYGLPATRIADASPTLGAMYFTPDAPLVTAVEPPDAAVGILRTFKVSGANLPDTLWAALTDCEELELLDVGPTRAHFSCTPATAGTKEGWLYDDEGGALLFEFQVEVVEADAWCDAVCGDDDCGIEGECDCGECACDQCDECYECDQDGVCVPDCDCLCEMGKVECGEYLGCECGECEDCSECTLGQCAEDCDCACDAAGMECGDVGACQCGDCGEHHTCTDGLCEVDCDSVCDTGGWECGDYAGCDCGGCDTCSSCCSGVCTPDCACVCSLAGVGCGKYQGCDCGYCTDGEVCNDGQCKQPGKIHLVYWIGNNCIKSGGSATGCVETSGHVGDQASFTMFDDDDHSLPDTGPTFTETVLPSHFNSTLGTHVTCFTWSGICSGSPSYCKEEYSEGDEAEFFIKVTVGNQTKGSIQTWDNEMNVGIGFTPAGWYCHY